jgi:hypothetical protein
MDPRVIFAFPLILDSRNHLSPCLIDFDDSLFFIAGFGGGLAYYHIIL